MIPPVVDQDWLRTHPGVVLADVRWYLDGRSGADSHAAGHIPGAVWVDVDTDLAATPSREAGRHPFPTPEHFAGAMSTLGIGDDSVVVAYDDAGGLSAGRLVWMLRLLGHDAALLDGGIGAWTGELETGESPVARGTGDPPTTGAPHIFTPRPWPVGALVDIEEAQRQAATPDAPPLLDARAAERFRGEVEPTDAPPGHIPGAVSAPLGENFTEHGTFRDPEELRAHYARLGVTDASDVIAQCGSGVSACVDLLAMERAGLGRGRLYVGSWSQYAFSGRPVATGR